MRTATLHDPALLDSALLDPARLDPAGPGRIRYAPAPRPRPVVRPGDRRPAPTSAVGTPRLGGTHCAAPVGDRGRGPRVPVRPATPDAATITRRRRTAAILAGVALALSVWVIAVLGQNYAASVTPDAVGTEVVHVRSGDSLSTIASRIAPDMPREIVIDEIVALNDLPSSGLRVGQPLLTPRYS